jgi:PncC family amidohydrolase
MLGQVLTSVPGASDVFWGGVISYDDAAKVRLLGVRRETLVAHGAVSKNVAVEMARGVRDRSGCTWSLAITGVAGPGGGTPEKPVGTVWVALEGPRAETRQYRFSGDRDTVRHASVEAALELLGAALERREVSDGA